VITIAFLDGGEHMTLFSPCQKLPPHFFPFGKIIEPFYTPSSSKIDLNFRILTLIP
jgi:hypothetical protein